MQDINFITQSSLDIMLIFSILAPMACGFFSLLCGNANRIREIGVTTLSVLHLVNIINIKYFFDNFGVSSYHFISFSPGIDVSFSTEPYGIIFAIMVSVLWLVTNIYSSGYVAAEQKSLINKDTHAIKFHFFMSLSIAATIGVSFAANLLTFYICYEILTFTTYPLVNIAGSEHAIKAGRKYLMTLLFTSLFFFLPAILYLYSLVGGMNFMSGGILQDKINDYEAFILLFLFVMGVAKTAIMPFHFWLPIAMVAPHPVSALLHAVAVVKTGIFALIKIVVYIFGVDFLYKTSMLHPYIREWFVVLCCITIIYGAIKALQENTIKKILAYSTISQLAYSLLAISIFTPKAIFAGFIHMIAHALAKIVLFFTAGAIYASTGISKVSEMAGIARFMPAVYICFVISALSLIGIPPLGGFFSKYLIIESAINDKLVFIIYLTIIIGTILTIAYFLKFFYVAMLLPEKHHDWQEVPLSMKYSIIFVTALTVGFIFIVNYLYKYLG